MKEKIITNEEYAKLDWAFAQIHIIMKRLDLDELFSKQYPLKVIRNK